MVNRLKVALERTLSEELRDVVEWAAGLAWDAAKRREAFEDTGLDGGESLMAVLWSEFGRLQRERTDEGYGYGSGCSTIEGKTYAHYVRIGWNQ